MSYTKGPWKVETNEEWIEPSEGERVVVYGISASDKSIVSTNSGYYKLNLEDANLIAAAPELVEALETAKRALDRLAEIDQIYLNDTYAQIVKALTKAKGGQP